MAKVRQEDSHTDSARFAASGLLLCCPFHYYKSFCHVGEGADQLRQHPSAGHGGSCFADKLLGIPALQNCTSLSTKEHISQLKFIMHICKSKRINSCETDHSLSRLLNPQWKSTPTCLLIPTHSLVKQTSLNSALKMIVIYEWGRNKVDRYFTLVIWTQ